MGGRRRGRCPRPLTRTPPEYLNPKDAKDLGLTGRSALPRQIALVGCYFFFFLVDFDLAVLSALASLFFFLSDFFVLVFFAVCFGLFFSALDVFGFPLTGLAALSFRLSAFFFLPLLSKVLASDLSAGVADFFFDVLPDAFGCFAGVSAPASVALSVPTLASWLALDLASQSAPASDFLWARAKDTVSEKLLAVS